ncbi:MAG: hypothetical protein WCH98_20170, partial [Verrucomicrobiota bacterium]
MALDSSLVQARLQEAGNRFRWSRGGRWVVAGTAVSMFFLVVFLLCDARFHFGPAGRWAALLLTILPALAGVSMALPAWLCKMSDEGIARRIERSCTGAGNVLISAVQFDRDLAQDSAIRSALFQEMRDPFPGVRWAEVFDLNLLKKLAAALVGIALVLAAWALLQPAYFANSAARIFLPAGDIAPLTRTRILEIQPGDTEVAHGRETTLTAKLGGQIPGSAWVHFRVSGATWQKALMVSEAGQPDFSFTWKEVREPLEYFVEAGDARSATCRIRVRPRTAIRDRAAEIEPPPYTRLPSSTVQGFSILQNLVSGSRVGVTLEFNNPVENLRVAGENRAGLAVSRLEGNRWKLDGKIVSTESAKLEYSDANGVADTDSLQFTVKADAAPVIRLTAPSDGREIATTRDATLPVQCTVTDDFGIGSVAVFKSTNDKTDAQLVHEWKDAGGKVSFVAETQIPRRQFIGPDEESATFCVIAKDRNDVSGPGVAVSRPIIVKVLSPEKLQKQSGDERARIRLGIEELIKLQQTNLDETHEAIKQEPAVAADDARLLDRQSRIADMGKEIADSPDTVSPELRSNLRSLGEKEMREALVALRNAANMAGGLRAKSLGLAADLEAAILARLKGAPAALDCDSRKEQIQDLIAGVEDLLRQQREIYRETNKAQSAQMLSERQDALAEQSARVRKQVGENARNAAMSDKAF